MQRRLPPFDELMDLASNRPEEFERLRVALCEEAISRAPKELQPQLRGLQFRIDMESRRCSNPLARCIRISAMMHASLAELAEALNHGPEAVLRKRRERPRAEVIPFDRR